MKSIRSLVCAGLALAALAFTMAMPAVAATPTDPGVYEAVKASIETPAVLQVHEVAVALPCEASAVDLSRDVGRSSVEPSSLTFASTPVAVAAYLHIDPGRAGL